MADFNPKNYTIEEWYGVEQGDDWLEVAMQAPFKRGQRVQIVNQMTMGKPIPLAQPGSAGTVLDVRRMVVFGQLRWDILVDYDHKNVPSWARPDILAVEPVIEDDIPEVDTDLQRMLDIDDVATLKQTIVNLYETQDMLREERDDQKQRADQYDEMHAGVCRTAREQYKRAFSLEFPPDLLTSSKIVTHMADEILLLVERNNHMHEQLVEAQRRIAELEGQRTETLDAITRINEDFETVGKITVNPNRIRNVVSFLRLGLVKEVISLDNGVVLIDFVHPLIDSQQQALTDYGFIVFRLTNKILKVCPPSTFFVKQEVAREVATV
jgi:hypothetical protein